MPHRFRVGDTVRFLNDSTIGGERFGRQGQTAIIEELNSIEGRVRPSYRARLVDPTPGTQVGRTFNILEQDVELFDDTKVETSVFLVFYASNGGEIFARGARTLENANQMDRELRETGAQVLGRKKFTTRVDRPNNNAN